jgi:hypothetical protein
MKRKVNKNMSERKKISGLKIGIIAIFVVFAMILLMQGKVNVNQPVTNHAPEVTYHYDSHLFDAQGSIMLVVGVKDADGDKMNIQFWVRDNSSAEWKGIGNFEGFDGEYKVKTDYVFSQISSNVTPIRNGNWKITVTDGEKITTEEFKFFYTGKRI